MIRPKNAQAYSACLAETRHSPTGVETFVKSDEVAGLPADVARRGPVTRLQIGLNMPIAIPDLKILADEIRCTLSFQGRPRLLSIPWSAVVWYGTGEDLATANAPRAPAPTPESRNVVRVDFKRRRVLP